jgi:hypothetical protein
MKKENTMSKMGNWVLEMQEAAVYMDRSDFGRMFGESQLHLWDEINGGYDGDACRKAIDNYAQAE